MYDCNNEFVVVTLNNAWYYSKRRKKKGGKYTPTSKKEYLEIQYAVKHSPPVKPLPYGSSQSSKANEAEASIELQGRADEKMDECYKQTSFMGETMCRFYFKIWSSFITTAIAREAEANSEQKREDEVKAKAPGK